jgi:hypothetical protein
VGRKPFGVTGNGRRTLRLEFGRSAATKIEFSYLNDNLMVPIIHPLSLTFDFSSPKGGSSSVRMVLMKAIHHTSIHSPERILPEEENQ